MPSTASSQSSPLPIRLWHRRLGHLNFHSIRLLASGLACENPLQKNSSNSSDIHISGLKMKGLADNLRQELHILSNLYTHISGLSASLNRRKPIFYLFIDDDKQQVASTSSSSSAPPPISASTLSSSSAPPLISATNVCHRETEQVSNHSSTIVGPNEFRFWEYMIFPQEK